MKTLENYLMIAIFVLAFLGIIGLITNIISLFLWLSAAIYLFAGWKLLSPSQNTKMEFIPFLISYLIAQTVVTIIFGINIYPLKNEFSYVTTGLLIITIILLLVYKKDLIAKYPINKYLTRLVVCVMFSLTPLWTDITHKI